MTRNIEFFVEDIQLEIPKDRYTQWLTTILTKVYHYMSYEINYIYCSDEYLHRINVDYLNHDTYTDIITFPLEVTEHHISADIFISIPRIRENATKYNQTEEKELLRVMAHGLLHLFGMNDKTDEEKTEMRLKETEFVEMYHTIL